MKDNEALAAKVKEIAELKILHPDCENGLNFYEAFIAGMIQRSVDAENMIQSYKKHFEAQQLINENPSVIEQTLSSNINQNQSPAIQPAPPDLQ